ncbi:hypothetical protein L6452_36967 [Arctium lappa]|uniref:Uncharacterized protein n=1 Tax=Arctium lappa TaxID=4217 RepID=A0ACB8Y2D1_ARCLA|nr:hypothetical protein L6452_36967 [Arctium lappa]
MPSSSVLVATTLMMPSSLVVEATTTYPIPKNDPLVGDEEEEEEEDEEEYDDVDVDDYAEMITGRDDDDDDDEDDFIITKIQESNIGNNLTSASRKPYKGEKPSQISADNGKGEVTVWSTGSAASIFSRGLVLVGGREMGCPADLVTVVPPLLCFLYFFLLLDDEPDGLSICKTRFKAVAKEDGI